VKKKRRLLQSDTFWGAAAVLLVILQFWWLPGEDGSAADSYSTTVDGKLGLFRTLSALFPEVRRESAAAAPQGTSTLIIVAPDEYPTSREEEELRQFVYQGGCLLFAPSLSKPSVDLPGLGIQMSRRWSDLLRLPPGATGPVSNGAQTTPSQESGATTDDSTPVAEPSGITAEPEASAQQTTQDSPQGSPAVGAVPSDESMEHETPSLTISGPLSSVPFEIKCNSNIQRPGYVCEVLLGTELDPQAIAWTYGAGQIVVCCSSDIFSNRSMLFRPSRRAAVRLVERAANLPPELAQFSVHNPSQIVISEYFNTTDAYRSTGVLLSPMMRIGTLQLLLVAVLGIWLAFHRFGPASDTVIVHRRSLQESAEAVGNLQYRLSDGGAVIRSYLDYLRSQLRRRYGSSVRLEDPQSIANKARMDVDEVTSNLQEAIRMAGVHKLSAHGAAMSIRWLSRLQLRLFGNKVTDETTA
jgi:hypothetical protein